MALPREQALKTITDGLGWIVAQAQLRSAIHLFDSNTLVHELFRGLLSEVYDLRLVVTDRIRPNFPAIDLGDETAKRSFQVTTENDHAKIQATLDAFDRHSLASRFGKLQVIVIGARKGSYKSLKVPAGIPFAWDADIIDTPRLIKTIESLPIEKIERVAEVVRRELRLPGWERPKDARPQQSSKIASCCLPLRLPKSADGIDPKVAGNLLDLVQRSLSDGFSHTCATTGLEDFVCLLTLDQADRESDPGYVPIDLELFCHVSEFVRATEEFLNFIFERGGTGPAPRLQRLPGKQRIQVAVGFGRHVPVRLYRSPPSVIEIREVYGLPLPPGSIVTTSHLLCTLAAVFKGKALLWDDADQSPDLVKVLAMSDRINKRGFSWDAIKLDPADPEKWEYTG